MSKNIKMLTELTISDNIKCHISTLSHMGETEIYNQMVAYQAFPLKIIMC